MPIRRGATAPGCSIRCRFCLPPRNGARSKLGVAQRARLFDALLADLYGPQRLLADGTVPAQLPFGHPNFLWPCHGIEAGGRQLAARLRGRYLALRRRPMVGTGGSNADSSGPGYALENRQIVSRVFPDLLSDVGVRSLGAFFVAIARESAGGRARG